jgi:hypothetical protein
MITVNDYVCNLSAVPGITIESLKPWIDTKEIEVASAITENTSYFISWGDPKQKIKCGTMETGFFWDSLHIDTLGLYSQCSLNTPYANQLIRDFKAPRSATDIILRGKNPPSKFKQSREDCLWEGVVLALQNPSDRSIHRGSSTEDYYKFVEGACKFYGKNLFLKLHPWNSGEIEQRFRSMASENGCSIGRVNHTVLDKCKFCLVYNSTFTVDCLIRGIKVAYFAPGYFYQAPGVFYTSFQYPDDVPSTVDDGYKLCDFLVWRYCWNQKIPIDNIVSLLKIFANSKDMFRLPTDLSYAGKC